MVSRYRSSSARSTACRAAPWARSAPLPALAALLLYVLLTGATPAGLRSALMWTLALAATHFGRRSDGATSLALAGALLALVTPRILWDLGFQLSLSGTAAIVLLTPGIERRLARLPAAVREVTAVSLAAQAETVPLVAAGFAQVSLVAPLANALLLPLLGPIIVLGATPALAGALVPSLGALLVPQDGSFSARLAWCCMCQGPASRLHFLRNVFRRTVLGLPVYPFLALLAVAVQALALAPLAAFPSATWPLAIVGGYYLLLGLSTRGLLRAEGPAPRDCFVDGPRLVWLRPVAALGAAAALVAVTVAWQAPRGRYILAVLPLGASQGLLLTTPGGSTALIDAGDTPSALNAALGSSVSPQ